MALANDPRLMITEWISDFYRRRIRRFFAHPGDDHSEKEGEARGDEGDERCLDLEQGQIAKDDGVPDGRRVEVAQVGCGPEAGRKSHFYVTFEIEDDWDDRN